MRALPLRMVPLVPTKKVYGIREVKYVRRLANRSLLVTVEVPGNIVPASPTLPALDVPRRIGVVAKGYVGCRSTAPIENAAP